MFAVRYGRRRRTAVVVAVALGLLVAGCGQRANRDEPRVAYKELRDVPEALDEDGTTIRVGDPEAPVTVHLYEDPRCPYCEEFEQTGGGPAARERTLGRTVVTEYTLASFLDGKLGGSGSERAVNALRAALEKGKFAEYHAVLYDNQPEEAVDGFTDARLLKLADEVDGLRGPAFDSAVRTMKYRDFVSRSEKAYERAGGSENPGGPGTPTAAINGRRIVEMYGAVLYDRSMFDRLLKTVEQDPMAWADDRSISQDMG
ncbi:DsbA family protein [Streptomyces scabiei]|uniref:DsbA family protein n=1 Tax=Streptomyces scabiei TaxID=1930 RepID=UPI000566B51E|nr:thioredoxin domain-containing protein [Streptomyces scabiei]